MSTPQTSSGLRGLTACKAKPLARLEDVVLRSVHSVRTAIKRTKSKFRKRRAQKAGPNPVESISGITSPGGPNSAVAPQTPAITESLMPTAPVEQPAVGQMTKKSFENAVRIAKRESHQVRKSAVFDAPDAVFVPAVPLEPILSPGLPSRSVESVRSYHWKKVVRQDTATKEKVASTITRIISRKLVQSVYCGTGCEVCKADLMNDWTTTSNNITSKTAASSSLTVSSALTRTMTASTNTSTELALNDRVSFWPSGMVQYTALDVLTGSDSAPGYTGRADLAYTSNGLVDKTLAAGLAPIERSLDPWHSALTGPTLAWRAEMQDTYHLVDTRTQYPNDGCALGRAYCGLRVGGAPFAPELAKRKKRGHQRRRVQK
ncbi:hypothetical protein LTS18_005118 [Coniosporium uncinatum]|uniref:Uncharacterized protein n=1 Tax=Coniosporium uncinatum TaxID=93489 RepID=A0ACC3DS21_9PEZI|nr:hypothetical protein LTS18_005118 [Coniosporium uncinatum]